MKETGRRPDREAIRSNRTGFRRNRTAFRPNGEGIRSFRTGSRSNGEDVRLLREGVRRDRTAFRSERMERSFNGEADWSNSPIYAPTSPTLRDMQSLGPTYPSYYDILRTDYGAMRYGGPGS